MAYTHNFQIQINGVDVEGELSFNSGEPARVKYFNSPEMDVDEWSVFTELFQKLCNIYARFGALTTFEISIK